MTHYSHLKILNDDRVLGDGTRYAEVRPDPLQAKYELQLAPVINDSSAVPLEPAVRFAIEAQMEGLGDILEVIDKSHPELWRQTDQSRRLLDRMQILLNRDPIN